MRLHDNAIAIEGQFELPQLTSSSARSTQFGNFKCRSILVPVLWYYSAAFAVLFALHRVRDFLEHWIERLFFSQWHLREAELRQFVRRAAHFTGEAALLDAFVAALGRFTRGAGCAIYLQAEDGAYECTRSTTDGSLAAASRVYRLGPRVAATAGGGDPITFLGAVTANYLLLFENQELGAARAALRSAQSTD